MLSGSVFAAADVEKGYQWLLEQHQADGAFLVENSVATDFQAAHESLAVLTLRDKLSQSDKDKAIDLLAEYPFWDTESIQRFLSLAASHAKRDKLKQALLAHQAANGGFGGLPGHDANVMDTAFALLILSELPAVEANVISRALHFLTQLQQPDGSFRLNDSNERSVYLTALVSRALQRHLFNYQVGIHIERANQYLLEQQQAENGWGETWLTAYVLQALIPTVTDNTAYTPALNMLASRQQATGAWEGDLYITALALHVLHLSSSLTTPTSPSAGRVTGMVANSATSQPLSGVTIHLQGVVNYEVTSGTDGQFVVADVEAGSYTAKYSLAGYLEATQAIEVEKGRIVNVGTVALNAEPTQGVLSGVVVDGESGLPLSGVQVTVSGQGAMTTDAQGAYTLIVTQPNVEISVSADGYQSIKANGTVPLGQHVTFSPKMYQQPPGDTSVYVSGRILERDSKHPIAGVQVAIEGTTTSVTTDANGMYDIQSDNTEVTLQFTANGYSAGQRTLFGAPGAKLQAGDFYLVPQQYSSESSVSGQIVDQDTGKPIVGAVVEIATESLKAKTNVQGQYQLTGITGQELMLLARADGYLSQTLSISAAEPSNLTANFALDSASQLGVDIISMQTSDAAIEAYQRIELNFVVENAGNDAKNLLILTDVVDHKGEVVKQVALGSDTGQVDANVLQTVLPGAQESYLVNWFSGITPPGVYTYRVRLFDGLSSTVLAQRAYPFTVKPTRKLVTLTMVPRPQFGHVGQNVGLDFIGTVENRSNVPVDLSFGYLLQAPESGDVALSGGVTAMLEPETLTYALPITPQAFQLAEKGDYTVHVAVHSEALPESIITKPIVVSPTTRLKLTQGILPEQVVPNGNQRVSVKINLEGVE